MHEALTTAIVEATLVDPVADLCTAVHDFFFDVTVRAASLKTRLDCLLVRGSAIPLKDLQVLVDAAWAARASAEMLRGVLVTLMLQAVAGMGPDAPLPEVPIL
jgi:hypothetical protein